MKIFTAWELSTSVTLQGKVKNRGTVAVKIFSSVVPTTLSVSIRNSSTV
jgi:hypothetical protein